MSETSRLLRKTSYLLELAWAIISNAGNGDWDKESDEWRHAAMQWRKCYFKFLGVSDETWLVAKMFLPADFINEVADRFIAQREKAEAKGKSMNPEELDAYLEDEIRRENDGDDPPGYRDGDGKKPWRPKIVCLCGSTKFKEAFQKANLDETLAGNIVLSVGCYTHSDDELRITEEQKKRLDELHLRKIDLADEVFVLNVRRCTKCGCTDDPYACAGAGCDFGKFECDFQPYIGESTAREIEYAKKLGKPIRYLVTP
jgi:hypothetical protein